ncbi:phosphoglycerate kinase-like [Rattus rattus]|uniref:phosphoglycerate kinase-like n=1 Tax=Rattus rattus TaxID=10117 RepID=UPI0013F2CF0C|nr:phosphoglycerate kinase-like [Rattus rattus]
MPCYCNKRRLSDLDFSKFKRVVIRLDLNVPIQGGKITDNNRIVKALPTVNRIMECGSQLVVLSHLSRIKSLDDINSGKKSLKPIADEFMRLLPDKKIMFISDIAHEKVKAAVEGNPDVNIFILENTRYYDVDSSGSVVKQESKNDPALAKFWASLGDAFVNDAFGTTHRKHASNVGIAGFLPSAMGMLIEKELRNLSDAVESKASPKFLILGGSKVSDKIQLINSIAPKVDKILVGGGMVYTFLKAMGKEVGKSIVEDEMIDQCKSMLREHGSKIVLPVDHVVAPEFKDMAGKVVSVDDTSWKDMMALDIGPATAKLYCDLLSDSKVVI